MKPHITVITLGVDDLERALIFYRDGLGLKTKGIVGTEYNIGAVVFFDMQDGLKLALWPRESLAGDAGVSRGPRSSTEVALAHNVSSRGEVNKLMERARKAGALVTKEASEAFWGGYAGYFQDLDGHLWEIAWNPKFSQL